MKRISWMVKSAVAAAAVAGALLAGAPASTAATTQAPASVVHPFDSKSAVWGELHSGDCQQDGGTIVLNSDGTGSWSATTLTYQTHSGDVWHASFDFYTTAGTHLFSAGTFDSPRMSDGNPPPKYSWSKPFKFDASLYGAVNIFKTLQTYSC